ncbi:hypothetical protein DASC09_057230 [Saccharomycopsis crataegensis]|uniref:DUF1279 domain-containing protein n=1 Tax=Saccharomycopsis crataegensis TaxID=43959 RepID=A0AAV5QV47_9ASCO|nr:hypothetical protein DASC09_057230 [Saccharomycopsis crataegensis]
MLTQAQILLVKASYRSPSSALSSKRIIADGLGIIPTRVPEPGQTGIYFQSRKFGVTSINFNSNHKANAKLKPKASQSNNSFHPNFKKFDDSKSSRAQPPSTSSSFSSILSRPFNTFFARPIPNGMAFFSVYELSGLIPFLFVWQACYSFPGFHVVDPSTMSSLPVFGDELYSIMEQGRQTITRIVQSAELQQEDAKESLEQIVSSGAEAYVTLKILGPLRIAVSYFAMTKVSDSVIVPIGKVFQRMLSGNKNSSSSSSVSESGKGKTELKFKKLKQKRL